MADIDLWLIEKYVRAPESLDVETRKAIEAYLEENAFASEAATFYREFYESLDAQELVSFSVNERKKHDDGEDTPDTERDQDKAL